MDNSTLLWEIAIIAAYLLGFILGLLLLYLVIRQAIFHGMREHTRWIDEGRP